MSAPVESIRTLHRIHQQLADLNGRLRRGPEVIRVGEKKVDVHKQSLKKAEEESRATRMAADDKNLQLKTKEGQIDDLKAKLNACSTNKEYQALQEQIAASEMTCSVLQDEILEQLEKVDEYQAVIAVTRGNMESAEEDLAAVIVKIRSAEGQLREELARVEAELAEAEKQLPPDLKTDYDRAVQSKGEDAMASQEGNCCGGCFQQLTPNNCNQLLMGQIIICQGCGRLVYAGE